MPSTEHTATSQQPLMHRRGEDGPVGDRGQPGDAGSDEDATADRLDQFYLDSVLLPSGTRQVSRIPGPLGVPEGFQSPGQCAGFEVEQDRYWIVPSSVDQFNVFITLFPPVGWRLRSPGLPGQLAGGYTASLPEFPSMSRRIYILDAGLTGNFAQEFLYLYYMPLDATHTGIRAIARSAGKCAVSELVPLLPPVVPPLVVPPP